ncbi:hypothetical protein Q73_02065 [Bacillus coahuilensis m2-6]|uniref:hypothetical protein n=1 Tax=Bacillus coahuilensis TaxID=408580 RepID=UPI0001850A81|nr:hypothetical protein [Bacillus coahuilensis]KUP09686.1 hypothetical protein Q73_02065 [Bacillus coahuilensis m2-6]
MWIESHLFSVLHEDGTLKEIIASSRDISSLIQSNRRYKTLLENSIDTIGLVMDDCLVYINDAGRHLFEVDDVNTLIGKHMFDRFNLEQYTTTLP